MSGKAIGTRKILGTVGFVAITLPGVAASMFIPNRVASSLVAVVWGGIAFMVVQWFVSRRVAREEPRWSTPESRRFDEPIDDRAPLSSLDKNDRSSEQFSTVDHIASYQPVSINAPSIDDLLGEPRQHRGQVSGAVEHERAAKILEPVEPLRVSKARETPNQFATQPLQEDAILSEVALNSYVDTPPEGAEDVVGILGESGEELLPASNPRGEHGFGSEPLARPEMATEKLDLADLREFDSGSVLVPMDDLASADTQDEIEAITAPSPQPELVHVERQKSLATRPFDVASVQQISPTRPVDMKAFSKALALESALRNAADEEATVKTMAPVEQRSTQQIEDMPALLSSLRDGMSPRLEEEDVSEVEEDEDATSRLENVAQLMSQFERELESSEETRHHPTAQVDWKDYGGLPES